jgi:hypothetical protein
MLYPASDTSLLAPGPALRVLGPTATPNSATIPSFMSLTVPASAQVGDYIVIASANGVVIPESSPIPSYLFRAIYGGFSTGSTFNENSSFFIKICRAVDIGSAVHLNTSGGFSVHAQMFIFTNPRRTHLDLSYDSGVPGNPYSPFDLYPEIFIPRVTGFSTGNSTSATIAPIASGVRLPPYCLKFTVLAANGVSNYPNVSYSGPGSVRHLQDSYWYRSSSCVYETNATNIGNQLFSFASSSFSYISVLLY